MNPKISIELVNSIADNLSPIVRDLAEVGLDNFLNEGVLREIPVINTVYSLGKTGIAIYDRLLLTKIINFLRELSDVSSEERQRFVEDFDKNPQKKRVFEETLLLLIERADTLEKPSILGRLLKHHILGHISYDDAVRLSFIVDRVYMPDLDYLTSFTDGIQSNPTIAASLQSVGLLNVTGIDPGNLGKPSSGGFTYELNEYGKMLLQYR